MTMPPDDETLMAYADGQLDPAARQAVEAAMAGDPALAARVQAHRALARRLAAAFDGVLAEPVPARLQQALQAEVSAPAADSAPAPAAVLDLEAAREARQARAAAAQPAAAPRRAADGWSRWGGMAACLVLGVVLGLGVQQRGARGPDGFVASGDRLVASGAVAQALQTQPAGQAGPVAVSFSFVDRAGRYCRAFSTAGQGGLACREGESWAVAALAAQPAAANPATAGTLRQASTALPPAVLSAVDESLAGSVLDAGAEAAALQRQWAR